MARKILIDIQKNCEVNLHMSRIQKLHEFPCPELSQKFLDLSQDDNTVVIPLKELNPEFSEKVKKLYVDIEPKEAEKPKQSEILTEVSSKAPIVKRAQSELFRKEGPVKKSRDSVMLSPKKSSSHDGIDLLDKEPIIISSESADSSPKVIKKEPKIVIPILEPTEESVVLPEKPTLMVPAKIVEPTITKLTTTTTTKNPDTKKTKVKIAVKESKLEDSLPAHHDDDWETSPELNPKPKKPQFVETELSNPAPPPPPPMPETTPSDTLSSELDIPPPPPEDPVLPLEESSSSPTALASSSTTTNPEKAKEIGQGRAALLTSITSFDKRRLSKSKTVDKSSPKVSNTKSPAPPPSTSSKGDPSASIANALFHALNSRRLRMTHDQ